MEAARKPIIIICGLVMILLWGLAPLLGSETVANFFGVKHAGEFIHWVRFFGMMGIVWGVMLIAAAIQTNKLVINFTIILFIFAIVLTLLMMFWLNELNTGEWIWWVNLIVTIVMCILLIAFYPKEKAQPAAPAAPAGPAGPPTPPM